MTALITQPMMASRPACARSSRGSSSYPASRNRNPSPTSAISLMPVVAQALWADQDAGQDQDDHLRKARPGNSGDDHRCQCRYQDHHQ